MKGTECTESKDKSNFLFFRFLFFVLWLFLYPNFRWIFHENSKNKNWKILKFDFSFDSAHCASFIKTGAKLKGGSALNLMVGSFWRGGGGGSPDRYLGQGDQFFIRFSTFHIFHVNFIYSLDYIKFTGSKKTKAKLKAGGGGLHILSWEIPLP